MQDTALYQYLLGLKSPWTVSRVTLDVQGHRVDVWAEHSEHATWTCPHCAKTRPLYDHAEERTWRHLDSCQFQTFLHARIPRVTCGEHGVGQVLVPWAEPRSRFTLLFERLAIDVLRQCDVSGATRILRISWDEAWGLMERAVTRGRHCKARRVVRRIGVDEKAAAKGHRYLTLVCDLDEGTVEHVGEDRKQESLDDYYAGLSPQQLDGIEAVAMDMWEPYIQATVGAGARGSREDRLRPLPHHESYRQGGGHGAEAGEPGVDGGRRRDAQGQQIPVAVQPGERAEAAARRVRRVEAPGAQGRPGVGHQGGAAPSVALRLPGVRLEVLEAVVFLGDA
jgi:transposase